MSICFELHRPANPSSKANLCFDALAETYNSIDNYSNTVDATKVGVFWGLVGHNSEKIKHCVANRIPWVFVDMPYWHRWTKHDLDWSLSSAHWRFVPNNFHPTSWHEFANTRLDDIGVEIDSKPSSGRILICPSSPTLTRHCIGQTDLEWVKQTTSQLSAYYPDHQIEVRWKPRAHGTSGPDVESVSVTDDLASTDFVVTLASIVGVEAAAQGIPVCATHPMFNPVAPLSFSVGDGPAITNTQSRKKWLNTLANYQYTLDEIKNKKLDNILNDNRIYNG